MYIYLGYMGVSVYWHLSVLCVFVRVFICQIRVLAKNHIMCQTSVNHVDNSSRFIRGLANFPFTRSETKHDY